ncbi:alcohol dehydrogenase catalytic domain-containing protein [Bradyrhizobium barranii]|uniref:alcohol dehydrogenase catalytic domain-containing protein n=1 Tax=Bradyrhizobium barranii TaxID=2992140 RepID=UPI0039C855A3
MRIVKTTICGTDLHILKGDVTTCQPGRILVHEDVGVVDQVGGGVTAFKAGDRVLISCIRPAANATSAGELCIRTIAPAGGSSATRSTARRPNMSGRRCRHQPPPFA